MHLTESFSKTRHIQTTLATNQPPPQDHKTTLVMTQNNNNTPDPSYTAENKTARTTAVLYLLDVATGEPLQLLGDGREVHAGVHSVLSHRHLQDFLSSLVGRVWKPTQGGATTRQEKQKEVSVMCDAHDSTGNICRHILCRRCWHGSWLSTQGKDDRRARGARNTNQRPATTLVPKPPQKAPTLSSPLVLIPPPR